MISNTQAADKEARAARLLGCLPCTPLYTQTHTSVFTCVLTHTTHNLNSNTQATEEEARAAQLRAAEWEGVSIEVGVCVCACVCKRVV